MTKSVGTVKDLIANGSITDVRFLRLNAEVRDEPDESLEDDDVQQRMELNVRSAEDTVECRITARVFTKYCVYEVIAATQVTALGYEIDDSIAEEFVSRIGFTVVYPYIREAIHSASARLRLDNVVVPLIDPESVTLNVLDGPQE